MNTHHGHKVLGHYCWDCQAKTAAAVPGWNKKAHGSLGQSEAQTLEVVWADGTRNSFSNCVICSNPRCSYPVHNEKYGYTTSKIAKEWNDNNQSC